MTKLSGRVQPRSLAPVLPFLIVPVLIGLSMLVQRPLSRRLGIEGPVWPLVPLARAVPWKHRLALRGAGLLFTFLLVLAGLFLQTVREQRLLPRVKVAAGMAAAEAGLQTNDLITAVDGVPVDDFAGLRDQLLEGTATKRLTLVRDGVVLERTATLREGMLGVQPSGEARATTKGEALQHAAHMLVMFPVMYARVAWRASTAKTAPVASAAPSTGPSKWTFAIVISLAFSWWLQLGVELGALGLTALRDGQRVR